MTPGQAYKMAIERAAAEIAQGVTHWSGCTPELPCVRCERDAAEGKLETIRNTLRHPESDEHYALLLRINQSWRDATARKLLDEHRMRQRAEQELEALRRDYDTRGLWLEQETQS